MLKQKTFNYITLILAIITIFMVISANRNNTSIFPCVVMLVITFIFCLISKKYNDEILYMNKKDKEVISEIEHVMKNSQDDRNRKVKKVSRTNKKKKMI